MIREVRSTSINKMRGAQHFWSCGEEKHTALLIMRWGEAHSASMMKIGNDVIHWWAIIPGFLDKWGNLYDQVQFLIMCWWYWVMWLWVHGFVCPKVHIRNRCDLMEWTTALDGMYESALVFVSVLKQKNLYIVGCVQCIWDITAYFLLPELQYYYKK
jgi:hypothetical protein